MAESELQERLSRLGKALLDDVERWEVSTRGARHEAIGQVARALGSVVSEAVEQHEQRQQTRAERREAQRREREEERAQRRREREEESIQQASWQAAVVFFLAALGAAVYGLVQPHLFWMLFVALGFGLAGADQARKVARRAAGHGRKASAAVAQETRAHEVDVLCDRLLADLQSSPDAVKAFVQAPEQTVESLRQTCKALDARRQQLQPAHLQERLRALESQAAALEARRSSTSDGQAAQKLGEALFSVRAQLEALQGLQQQAERADAEYLSLLTLLQELNTRVALARTTTGAPSVEAVRKSVARLNDEVSAITDALEATARREASPVTEVGEAASAGAARQRISS